MNSPGPRWCQNPGLLLSVLYCFRIVTKKAFLTKSELLRRGYLKTMWEYGFTVCSWADIPTHWSLCHKVSHFLISQTPPQTPLTCHPFLLSCYKALSVPRTPSPLKPWTLKSHPVLSFRSVPSPMHHLAKLQASQDAISSCPRASNAPVVIVQDSLIIRNSVLDSLTFSSDKFSVLDPVIGLISLVFILLGGGGVVSITQSCSWVLIHIAKFKPQVRLHTLSIPNWLWTISLRDPWGAVNHPMRCFITIHSEVPSLLYRLGQTSAVTCFFPFISTFLISVLNRSLPVSSTKEFKKT